MKLKIAFDLDGVLVNLLPVIEKHLYDLFGNDGALIKNGKFKLQTAGNHSNNQIWKAINLAYGDINSVKPFEGALELLTKLYGKSHEPITIITARPERAWDATKFLIEQLFHIPCALIMTNGKTKVDHLKTFGFKYYVEDRRKNALEIAGAGITSILVDRPYNKIETEPINLIRIYTLRNLLIHTHKFVGEDTV